MNITNNFCLLLLSIGLLAACGKSAPETPVTPEPSPFPPTPSGSKDTTRIESRANCFIVKPGTLAIFAPCKGNSKEDVPAAAARLLWQDDPALVSSAALKDGKIEVDILENKTGNALVCATDAGGAVLWSWHLWVVPNAFVGDVTVFTSQGNYTFQDCNLGALSALARDDSSTGLVYQWGRKDPFPGPVYTDATAGQRKIYNKDGAEIQLTYESLAPGVLNNLATAMAHPEVSYWSTATGGNDGNYSWLTTKWDDAEMDGVDTLWNNAGHKTLYDPCPEGYKVADTTAWSAVFAQPDTTTLFNRVYVVSPDISSGWAPSRRAQFVWQSQFRGVRFGGMDFMAGGYFDHQGRVKSIPTDKAIHARSWTSTTYTPRTLNYHFGAYAAHVGPDYTNRRGEFKFYDSSPVVPHKFSTLNPVRCRRE
ncbi:MAG: hypothetical protein J6Y32_01795 [Bacteroidales bacterium]|nr:hypothetical protein [Bacteroidales bacterium]